jgi:hypothetical protein
MELLHGPTSAGGLGGACLRPQSLGSLLLIAGLLYLAQLWTKGAF